MTNSQRLSVRLSEIRQRLNEVAGLEGDSFTAEIRAESEKLQAEFADKETQYRSAVIAEADAEKRALETSPDAETRERAALRGRVKLSDHVAAAMEGRGVDGASLEYNQALGLKAAGAFPLELLSPPEKRATTDTDSSTAQNTWLDRLFSDTAAMRLGVTFESVAPGVASFPVTTAGATAAQRGRSESATAASWTVGVTELKPTRNAVRAIFSEEDSMRLPGLEEALRRDLSMVMTEGVDRIVFVGDSGASEATADIAGLTTISTVNELTITQASKVQGPATLSEFASLIDGKHANSLADLRVVAAVGCNILWLSTVINATASNQTLAQFLMASGLSWTARGDIETDTLNDDFGAFIGRGRGIEGAGVAAVWNSGILIRDPYTEAAKGEVALTLSYFWNFGLPRPSNFSRIKFVT